MTRELTSPERVERANQARRVLEDSTMQKAWEALRSSLIVQLEASSIGDRDLHHEIALSLQAIRSLRRVLENWVNDGEVEKRRNAQ